MATKESLVCFSGGASLHPGADFVVQISFPWGTASGATGGAKSFMDVPRVFDGRGPFLGKW